MPIAGYTPEAAQVPSQNLVEIAPKEYLGVVNDDCHQPVTSLLAYVEGAPWPVEYFSQIVGAHNDLREIDPGQYKTYQQYKRIMRLELRVQQALTTSHDSATSVTTVTGSSLVLPPVVPNIGDHFVSEVGDNQKALYSITALERKTHNRDAVFEVSYTMMGYLNDPNIKLLYDDLVVKSNQTYYYDKELTSTSAGALLTTQGFDQLQRARLVLRQLLLSYFRSFYSRSQHTLILPGQSKVIYDHYLTDYLLKIVESTDAQEIRYCRRVPMDRNAYMSQPQFWDALIRREPMVLKESNLKMGVVSKLWFERNNWIAGAAYHGVDYFVYPKEPDSTLYSVPADLYTAMVGEIDPTESFRTTLLTPGNNAYSNGSQTLQKLHAVYTDDYYVLSQAFYENTSQMSVLEILTKDYLQASPLNANMVLALTDDYSGWKRLEQFYYGPLLITFLKEMLRCGCC